MAARSPRTAVCAALVLVLAGCASTPADPAPPASPLPQTSSPPMTAARVAAMEEPVIAFSFDGQVQVAPLSGSTGVPVAPDAGVGEQTHPDWSPDGRQLVFRSGDDDGTQDIWITDLEGTASQLFDCSDPCAFTDDPAWRPDGAAVLFERLSRTGPDTGRYELVVQEVRSGEEEAVLTMTGSESPYRARWSPDGTRIVTEIVSWASGSVDESRQLAVRLEVLDVATGRTEILIEGGSEPDWDPAGDRIVFTMDAGTGAELFTVPASGGEPTRLTHLSDSGGRVLQGRWSAAGLVAVWEQTPGPENARAGLIEPDTGEAITVSSFGATHPVLRP